VVREGGEVDNAARKLMADIGNLGVKVRLDGQTVTPLGRRITDWELKGLHSAPAFVEPVVGQPDQVERVGDLGDMI